MPCNGPHWRIGTENRHYGYRRITYALRAQGWDVNHKRVARLMRLDNLLATRKRRFAPLTTDSKHDLEIAINVARRLTPTAVNQLWVADITYVRLGRVDVFLAVVMDAFSRKIVGWNIAPTLATELALAALRNANRVTPSSSRTDSPFRPWRPICLRHLR